MPGFYSFLKILCITVCSLKHHNSQEWLWTSDPSVFTSWVLGLQSWTTHLSSTVGQSWGWIHAKPALYQQSYSPSPYMDFDTLATEQTLTAQAETELPVSLPASQSNASVTWGKYIDTRGMKLQILFQWMGQIHLLAPSKFCGVYAFMSWQVFSAAVWRKPVV